MKNCFIAVVLLVLPVVAQQRQKFTINTGTPEGQMLQAIGQETDDAKKITLMQDFLSKYPKHEGVSWVCGQLEASYLAQKEYDKALDAAEKGFAADPEDADIAFNGIKAAEGKDDADAVKTWAVRTAEAARKITGGKAPANDEEKQAAEHAKDLGTYAEYALYSQAVKSKDNKKTADLGEALEKVNPKSTYLWQVLPVYLRAEGPRACATADRLGRSDPKNAEALLYAADCSWRGNNPTAMVAQATKAREALGSRPKVEGVSDAGKSGMADFYIGVGYSMQQRFGPAEKALRAALPSVKGDSTLAAYAYFHLGLSIYSLSKPLGDKTRMREGMGYFEQSAALKSSVQDQASRNARLIKTELGGR